MKELESSWSPRRFGVRMRVSQAKMRVSTRPQGIQKDARRREGGGGGVSRAEGAQKTRRIGVRPTSVEIRKATSGDVVGGRRGTKGKGLTWANTALLVSAVAVATPGMAWADMDAQTAKLLASVLQPTLALSSILMIVRIPMTWYPNIDGTKWPWNLVYIPTEPILGPTRKIIQPVGGVDISPIVWVAVLSFLNEILLGPQGILNLLQMKV